MFAIEEMNGIKEFYELYMKENGDESDFSVIMAFSDKFDISADEVTLNKLDEEMTEDEYREWGPLNADMVILKHYAKHNAVISKDGILEPDKSKNIPPFKLLKKNKTNYTQEQRNFILTLLHKIAIEKTMSVVDLKDKLNLK